MHKIECAFCHLLHEKSEIDNFFLESPDKKTYICSDCLVKGQLAIAMRIRNKGFKLQLIKDSL